MKKILTVFSLLTALLASDLALAQSAKNNSSSKNSEQSAEDPDLKLSIDELKRKYPISLLDEKKKSYKTGQKINLDDYSIEEIKAALLNSNNGTYYNLVIKKACERFGWNYASPSLTSTQKRLQFFIFSDHKVREHVNKFAPDDVSFCLLDADPLGIEDRD